MCKFTQRFNCIIVEVQRLGLALGFLKKNKMCFVPQ